MCSVGGSPGPGLRNTVLWHSCEEPFKHICFKNLADTIHASEAAIKAVMVDLICLIRASSMEEKLFIVFVLVFIFQFLLFDHVVFPKCIVLDPFNLKGGGGRLGLHTRVLKCNTRIFQNE